MSRTNEFSIKLANVNGTGSASANSLIMKSMFRMGLPVSGKNLFPSNIQGLPTWYEIRVSEAGRTARPSHFDLMVAMNPQTYKQDVQELPEGGYLLYDSSFPRRSELHRDGITFLGVPLAEMCNEMFQKPRERILMKNMMYVGVLSALLDIDVDVIEGLIKDAFGRKPALLDSNRNAIHTGREYALKSFTCPLPMRLERRDLVGESILITGNQAAALGCVYAGATVASWYPITPSTSLVDGFDNYCQALRKDPETGKNNFCIIQAEDELAAMGMVLGASWNGARAFTATSGPGISLMGEFLGYAYYAEIPAVVFNVQRTGPSTGMPTRTQQADYLACAFASHGDTKHLLLFPADPSECFETAVQAFDFAERFQTPVMVLSDLDIGMNDWMADKLEWDDTYQPDRGKLLNADQLEKMERFFRYQDVDGDGVTYRTLPGVHPKGAYFTRGSGHTEFGAYTEDPVAYQKVTERLNKKYETARTSLPQPEHQTRSGARTCLVSAGGTRQAIMEATELLDEDETPVDFLRLKAFPFHPSVESILRQYDRVFVVEQNRDAQLRALLVLDTGLDKSFLESITVYGGFPLSAEQVTTTLRQRLSEDPDRDVSKEAEIRASVA